MPSYFRGAEQMKAKLRAFQQRFPDRVAAALYQEAQIEMTESKRRVPVHYGTLRASGTVHRPTRDFRGRVRVALTYGGAAAPYAIYVHENLDANHDNPPFKGGQAKYLESVLDESRPFMAARIARRLKANGLGV